MAEKINYHVTIDEIFSPLKAKSGISIKPENKGKFNATKKATGKSTEELTHSKNPTTKKRAIFAQSASRWHHAEDGDTLGPVVDPIDLNTVYPAAKSNITTGIQPVGATGPNTNSIAGPEAMSNPGTNTPAGATRPPKAPPTDSKNSIQGVGNSVLFGLTAFDAMLSNGKVRNQQVVRPPRAYNQHPYGTGSEALMKKGGKIKAKKGLFTQQTMDEGGGIYNPPFHNMIAQNVAEDKGGAPKHYYHADDDYYEEGGAVENLFNQFGGMSKVPTSIMSGAGGASSAGGFAKIAGMAAMADNGAQFGGYELAPPSKYVKQDQSSNLNVFTNGGELKEDDKNNLLVFKKGGKVPKGKYGYRMHQDETRNRPTFKNGGAVTDEDNLLVWENGGSTDKDNLLVWDDGGYIKKLNSKGKVIPNILANGSKISPNQARADRPYNQMTYYDKDIVAEHGSVISPEQAHSDYPYTQEWYENGGILPSSYGKDEDVNKLVFHGGGSISGHSIAGKMSKGANAPSDGSLRKSRIKNPKAVPEMEEGGRMIASGLGGPGKTYKNHKYLDSFDDSKLLTAEYFNGGSVEKPFIPKNYKNVAQKGQKKAPPIMDYGGPVGQKPVSQMTDAEVHAELTRPMPHPADLIRVRDTRTTNPVTNQKLRPDQLGGRSTIVNSDVIKAIVAQAKAKGVDPNEALAIASQESDFGKADYVPRFKKIDDYLSSWGGIDPNARKEMDKARSNAYNEAMGSLGHAWAYRDTNMIPGYQEPSQVGKNTGQDFMNAGADALAKALKEKNTYARQLGYTDDAHRLQTYNGLGKLGYNKTMGGKQSAYGVPLAPGQPLDLRKNPAYGKNIISIRDSVIRNNPALENIVNSTPAYKSTTDNSTAKMDNGGSVDVNRVIPHPLKFYYGGDADTISNNPYAGPTVEFKGPSHEEGGIGMSYGGKKVEVEGGETGVVDQQGDFNVMGNMVFPGTNTKFKALSKKISDQENSTNRKLNKGTKLMDESNPDDSYDYLRFNSGRALTIGADMRMKQLATAREKLGDVQKTILDTADRLNIDPQELSQGKYKAKNGAKINYADGGSIGEGGDPNKPSRSDRNHNPGNIKYGPWAKAHGATSKDADGFAIFDSDDVGKTAMTSLLQSKTYNNLSVKDAINKWTDNKPYSYDLGPLASKRVGSLSQDEFDRVTDTMRRGEGTKYGQLSTVNTPKVATSNLQPPDIAGNTKVTYDPKNPPSDPFKGDYFQNQPDDNPLPDLQGDSGNPIPSSTKFNKLNPTELAGEMYALATNRQIPVPTQRYTPTLLQPYSVSFQDRINENRETFEGMAKNLDYNPAALASLGAQKYSADNAIRGEEFRTNQGISQDIANKNTEILNQAQEENLKFADTQMVRQATARAKTRAEAQEALNSISSKVLQNNLENRRMQLYEPLFDYRLTDSNGDGKPDAFTYQGGPAQFNYSGLPVLNGSSNNPNARMTTTRDADGNIKSTRETDRPQIDSQLKGIELYRKMKQMYEPNAR